MRKFLILLVLPLFLGGKANNVAVQVTRCPCLDSADTTNPDSIKSRIIAPVVKEVVDSFKAVKQAQLDSLNETRADLRAEVTRLTNEKGKRVIVGHIDEIAEVPAMVDSLGNVIREYQPAQTWKWLFWKFPDGSRRYYKTLKIKH